MSSAGDAGGSRGDPPGAQNPDGYAVAGEIRLAAGVLLIQALGLVVVALVLAVKTFTSRAESLAGVLVTIILVVGGAALLFQAARGIVAGRPAFRSPVIVVELLCLPVGFSLLTAGFSLVAIPLLLTALAELYLLFTPAARDALQRPL